MIVVGQIRERKANVKIMVPRINVAAGELESIEITERTQFATTKWGIREPLGRRLADEREIDLVLVPLLCFDKTGNRVGYGKGYYDRFLAKCRSNCIKVGLSYFGPIDKIEGTHHGDVSLDYCVTPGRVFETHL